MRTEIKTKSDWAVHPGKTISDILSEKHISINDFSRNAGLTIYEAKQLIIGKLSISNDLAQILEESLGGSKSFWIKREQQYQEDFRRRDDLITETEKWFNELPIRDMVKFGWITPSASHREKKRKCLEFFKVSNAAEWYEKYEKLHFSTAFRISDSFESKPESILTWLRKGAIESNKIDCSPYDSALYQKSLNAIRQLTREKNPNVFIPQLKEICAKCGVALVIAPTPVRCSASAATFFSTPSKATLLLSFRYLSDDHFWFSFFHESGHIILHDRDLVFLEGVERVNPEEEKEADSFAANILIPEDHKDELLSFRANDWRSIIRFAKKLGISPGIVVGQLQYHGLVPHNRLNKLKNRYRWSDIPL
ncbi:MAG: ImmA/IrrE family metallo-endopeptidase [Candidatus Thiodiazotropha endolucinida]|nr:ImmA/IrrE family metallo-endopeptidase [Candidatus Thiodiazotropha endolucinida]